MSNRVTHFEIPCDNPKKTMKFFTEVFDWSFEQFGDQAYWFAKTGADQDHGINGAIMKKQDPKQPITNSINVADMDATTERIKAAGGEIVVPKMPVPGMGWLSFFKDPEGHIHGFWQNDKNAQ